MFIVERAYGYNLSKLTIIINQMVWDTIYLYSKLNVNGRFIVFYRSG